MALVPIPQDWIRKTVHILRNGQYGKNLLVRKTTAIEPWQALTGRKAFLATLPAALIEALLKPNLRGRPRQMDEEGPCYEFVFLHEFDIPRQVYAKIILTEHDTVVIVVSAHPPERQDELTRDASL
jgi:hypothetical protein